MAETTENDFKIPDYGEYADIPGMVRDNIGTAENILAEMNTTLSSLAGQMSAFDLVLQSMNELLGTLSDELDAANGEGAEG